MKNSDSPNSQQPSLQLSPFSETLKCSIGKIFQIVSKAAKMPSTLHSTDDNISDTSFSPIKTPSDCSTCPSSNTSESGDQSLDLTTPSTQKIKKEKDNDRYEPYSVHRPNYKRHPKPPYSYAGMIIMAIQMSPDKRLSLSEIHQCINNMFPFFRGTYRGWKDSVRHILSSSSCFYKVSDHRSNKWTVDLSLAPSNALHRQETIVSRSQFWHPTIYQYLGVPEVVIPKKQLFTFRPTDFSNHGVPKVVIPEKQLLTHRSTDFSNHGVPAMAIPEKQLPTHRPTDFSNHGVQEVVIPEKQLPTHRPTDFSNHGVPAMAIPEKQLPTHRPTDFSNHGVPAMVIPEKQLLTHRSTDFSNHGVPAMAIPEKQLPTHHPTDFSNHGVQEVVVPEKQLPTHRPTDFSNHGVPAMAIPEKQLPTHRPTDFSNHGVPAMAIPEKQLPTHRLTDFSNHGVPEMAIPEKQLPTHRPTDFSIDRILTKTPELAGDTRPLYTFDTSPTFNTKMSLKLKTRKSSNRPKQTPALVKLINDSAAKWGVSTDAAMEEIRQICNIMTTTSTSSHILPTTSCQVIKSEVTDRPTYSSAQLPVSSQRNTKRDIIPSMPSTSTSQLYRPYLDNQSHVTGQQPPSTYQQQHNTDQYSQYVSQQYQQYYNEQQITSQQCLQQYAIQQQYAMHQQYVYAEQHYQQQYVAQQQYEAQQQMSHYHGNQGYYQ